jgi:excinuclease UvrABC helicase subunit UvrB
MENIRFKLNAPYKPTGNRLRAVESLVGGGANGKYKV